MKKIFLSLLIVILVLGLTGCGVKRKDEDDIINYVKENLKLTDVKVLGTYKDIEDEYGYTDRLWTIIDNKNNITFHVLDDYSNGSPFGFKNYLKNDYSETVFIKLYDKIDVKENVIYNYDTSDSLNKVNLTCSFTNKKELKECYDSLLSYKKYVESKNFDLLVDYSIEYDFPFKNEYIFGNTQGVLNDLNQSKYDKAMYKYLSTALMFQVDSGVNEITEEDMKQILENDDTYLVFIRRSYRDKEQYEDIIARGSNISFGALYKILKKEGFNPVGTPQHYTVVNKSGDVFEISYDFNDYVYKDGSTGYYYKKNYEKISMDRFNSNYFGVYAINEMFGISLETKQRRFLSD